MSRHMQVSALLREAKVLSASALVFWASGAPVSGTELGRPLIAHHSPGDYEGHNQVFNSLQGKDGRMYFVNGDQVLRFDGERWDRAKVDTPFVRNLAPGEDGFIYVSAINEFGRLRDHPDGSFTYESLVPLLPQSLRPPGAVWILVKHDGALWFSVPGHVICWRDDAFQVIDTPYAERHLVIPMQGQLIQHVPGEGVFALSGDTFQRIEAPTELINTTTFMVVDRGPDRLPLVGVDGGSFRTWDWRTGETQIWHHEAEELLGREGLFGGRPLRSGNLLLTTRSATTLLLSPTGELLRVVGAEAGLDPAQVYGIRESEEGHLWIGSSKGVYRMELESPITVFDRLNGRVRGEFFDKFRIGDDLFTFTVEGIYRLSPGTLRAGTNAHWERLDLAPNMYWAVTPMDETALISTDYGLMEFDGSTLKAIPALREPVVTCVPAPGAMDRLFIGMHSGVRTLRRHNDVWVDEGAIGSLHFEARFIAPVDERVTWIGTPSRGYCRLRRDSVQVPWQDAAMTWFHRTNGLPDDQSVSEIVGSPAGPLFLTNAGVFRFDDAAERFVRADDFRVEGRSDFRLAPAVFDDRGRLWGQVTFPGRFDDLRIGYFDTDSDGRLAWHGLPPRLLELAGPRGVYGLAHEEIEGREILWVSGQTNTLRVDLADLPDPPAPPSVQVAALMVEGKRQPLARDAAAAPTLGFSRHALRVHYAAPPTVATDTVEYQWRIRGYHDNWTEWSAEAEASVTNLWGGPFTFEVRARMNSGAPGPAGRIVFHIAPPWYASPAAIAGYVGLVLAGVWLVLRWRVGKLHRERNRLEQVVNERTAELAVAKDAAESANRAKSTFLANMSHELRTPLNGVLGYAQIMLRDRNLPEANREQARIVASSGEHLLKMINEVLDFSKIEAGRTEINAAPFRLPDLLRDIEAAIAPRAAAKQLAFHITHDAALPAQCIGDAQKLRQVIDNLLSNAIKFTSMGSVTLEITRAIGTDRPQVSFAVSDTGVGLTKSDQAQLFQPFHQAVDGRPPEPGTGLGLSISRRLVELMGGEIQVTSRLGHGSRFEFDIPLEEIALADTDATLTEDADDAVIIGYRGRRLSLLVVDDVTVNRHLLRDLLEPLGFNITCDADAASALTRLETNEFDAVILDLRMPGIDGLELTRRLRAQGGNQPKVVLTSASVLSFDPQIAFDAGCDDFLPKPFREADLLQRLGRVLKLQWNYADNSPDSASPFGSAEPSPHLAELHAAADRGDIRRVRTALASLRRDRGLPANLLSELDELAANYRMDQLRTRLREIAPN